MGTEERVFGRGVGNGNWGRALGKGVEKGRERKQWKETVRDKAQRG